MQTPVYTWTVLKYYVRLYLLRRYLIYDASSKLNAIEWIPKFYKKFFNRTFIISVFINLTSIQTEINYAESNIYIYKYIVHIAGM